MIKQTLPTYVAGKAYFTNDAAKELSIHRIKAGLLPKGKK